MFIHYAVAPTTVEFEKLAAVFTKGDGNCMYNALSMLLFGDSDMHAVLREAAAREAYRNYGKIKDGVRKDWDIKNAWELYQKIATPFTYAANYLEGALLCKLLCISVGWWVQNKAAAPGDQLQSPNFTPQFRDDVHLNVLNTDNQHFEAMVPAETAPKIPEQPEAKRQAWRQALSAVVDAEFPTIQL